MLAIILFVLFIVFLLGLSWFFYKQSKTADGYFVADGQIHWFVNGVALTGGYLSAASFLGICGMIAFHGFDGFLYSIGFLSGWVVALFVVAEPFRRLGKYTFADALAARFHSKSIHFAASFSTLMICIFYLVPQMVGAGVLIEPLLGIPHYWGVIIVGAVVIVVVAGAGMASTTYVQFIKASMMISFSAVIVGAMLFRGIDTEVETRDITGQTVSPYEFQTIETETDSPPFQWEEVLAKTEYIFKDKIAQREQKWVLLQKKAEVHLHNDGEKFSLTHRGQDISGDSDKLEELELKEIEEEKYALLPSWWELSQDSDDNYQLKELQDITIERRRRRQVNGLPASFDNRLLLVGGLSEFGPRSDYEGNNKPIGPLRFLSVFSDPETQVKLPTRDVIDYGGARIQLFGQEPVQGNILMRPGGYFEIGNGNIWNQLNFISLMLALFFGTTALPHVLIRYYTVKDDKSARKSSIVAISSIGLFYILTLYLGLGAIASGVLNPLSDNMSAPLLARAFGEVLFAIITAIAFATVLGTVAGLIVAASGAVSNDFLDKFLNLDMSEKTKVLAARSTAFTVGVISVILGILFRGVNVGFLVGWAFAVAASANLPAIIMVVFWKKATPAGIISSILVGVVASIGIILMGPDMFEIYGLTRADAWVPLTQPAIISMPLSFITIVVVSLLTKQGKLNEKHKL